MRWPEVTDPRVFDALLELYRHGLDAPEQAVLEQGLEAAVSCTGSRFGYLHFVNDDQRTLELAAWSRETRAWCRAAYDTHYPLEAAGVWADAARLRTPQIHNDFAALAQRRGYPEGHVEVSRHLGVPVLENDRVRALVGVANREQPYGDDQVLVLQNFADVIWQLVSRRRQWERLLLEERRLSDLRGLWPVCIWEWSPRDQSLTVDSRFDAVVARSDGVGRPPASVPELLEYIHPADRALVAALFEDPPDEADLRLPLRGLRADGAECRLVLQVLSRRGPRVPRATLYGTLQDVTDREEAQMLRRQALSDPLTGLANRHALERALASRGPARRHPADRVAVHFIDLDGFKAVNDRLGHHAGDQCLQQVAQRLTSVTRVEDLVARLGGDEFLVLEVGISDEASALTLARKVVEVLGRPYDLTGGTAHIGASVGIAYGTTGDDVEALIWAADRALYDSKADGGGCVRVVGSA